MSYILFGSENRLRTCPFNQVSRVDYQKNSNDDNHSVTILLYRVGSGESVIYNEQGDESVVDAGEEVYRNILNGLEADTPVNLTEFSLTAPKKKAPAKNTEPEPDANADAEAPPEQPAE